MKLLAFHSILAIAMLTAGVLPAMGATATLRTTAAAIEFDLDNGTYSLAMPAGMPALRGAHAAVEEWVSTAAGCQRRVVEQTADRMLVECTRADAPTLLLEFSLHPGFVELRTGLKNTLTTPVRIKKMWPLAGGAIFTGAAWTDVHTLDAPSAVRQPDVADSAVRSSPNNLLLTFRQAGERHSLVLGALKTADFTKWVHTLSQPVQGTPGMTEIGYLDCGGAGTGPMRLQAVRGKPYTFPGIIGPAGTVLFDEKGVEFQATGLDPKKQYALGFSWVDQNGNGRVESVIVTGADKKPHTLIAKRSLPRQVAMVAVAVPAECHADGKMTIVFTNDAPVPNAVVSELWLWEMAADAKLPTAQGVTAAVEAYDPIGRLVDPGETYLPADSFYVDAGTANPFAALENYGLALRQATGAGKLNPYDFPTVCAWYAGVWKTPGAQNHPEKSKYRINTSSGLVGEAEAIKKSGFTNYSLAAVRLVPDSYTGNHPNPQGWWDDAHWQLHGYYTAPYETSAKLGQGMHANGCLAFTYIQPYTQPPAYKNPMSPDFREKHLDWIHNQDLKSFYNLDYSLPAVQDYMRSRFGALCGNIDGLMVDYADQLWLSLLYGRSPEQRLVTNTYENIPAGDKPAPPRLADPKMTATGFYRQFFSLVRAGLGPNARIHERNMEQPNNDLTLGIVDSQRTSLDSDMISPALVTRSGLRWYKNRVVLAYDMDSKELLNAWKTKGWKGSDQDGRRMTLTMAYVAASRLLIANSFRDLPPETLYDIERTFPYPAEPKSARPIDAFIHTGLPRVYDFAVTTDWHQVTLFNNALPTKEEAFAVPLAGDNVDGALGLEPAAEYHVYDFWNDAFAGTFKGTDALRQTLRPGEARMLSVRKVQPNPQVLSTNRHLMQGYYELADVKWAGNRLSGKAKVVANDPMKITIALNGRQPAAMPNLAIAPDGKLAMLTLASPENQTVEWAIDFK